MMRNWQIGLLGLSAAVAVGCSTDTSDEVEETDEVASVGQRELITCPAAVAASATTIGKEFAKELLINDLSVVQDECRTNWNSGDVSCTTSTKNKWHFWYLMQQMAGTNNVTRFVLRMLESIKSWPTPVNGMLLQSRSLIGAKVIDPWMTKTNAANGNMNCKTGLSIDDPSNVNCVLDPASTPLRLLAIVNRMDLRAPGAASGYGGGNAGEGRFVFGFVNLSGALVNGRPPRLNATMILEYKLPTPSFSWTPQQWAAKWIHLGTYSSINEAYKVELQAITNQFTSKSAIPGNANQGSAISQVRTNDFDFDQTHIDPVTMTPIKVWSLREFKLDCLPGIPCGTDNKFLIPKPVAQAPANISADAVPFGYNDTQTLQDYITQNAVPILAGNHLVPTSFNGVVFQGAEATSRSFGNPLVLVWKPLGWDVNTQTDTRRLFALSTCNGCHYTETETSNLHIAPRNHGSVASLSPFLQGQKTTTSDPSQEPFDYDEPARRACELAWLNAGNGTPVSTMAGRPH